MLTPQEIVDEVIKRTAKSGYVPEMAHKNDLLNCDLFVGYPDREIAIRILVEAFYSKAALVRAMVHLVDVITNDALDAAYLDMAMSEQS